MNEADDLAAQATDGAVPDAETDPTLEITRLGFSIVGIGASAGGLTALQQFFEQTPAQCGVAFVVVLHLSPKHESNAAAILQRSTRMPVVQVLETTAIEIDHVYVIPPNKHLSMDDGHLRLSEAVRASGRHIAIDLFFRTLAQVHKERAIAVVLSGTGADGAVGISRVKEQGGLTFAQQPEDAEYDGMPNAAIATDAIDFVLPVVEIPQKVLELNESARSIRLPPPNPMITATVLTDPTREAETALLDIKDEVRRRTGHDFTHYKRATVLRRLERRLQVNGLTSLPAYREFIGGRPAEVDALLQDLLISVTNFFRDRDAFESLEREVVPALFADRQIGEPVRVWVPGCASGEEAYSIAMQLRDWADAQELAPDFQIFATDIDERALGLGRNGLFPLSIVADVPAMRLRKYFTREDDRYRISKSLRDRVLFARHNILRDPPFSRIDLVCCRNLLIYIDRETQRQSLDTFRFSLGTSGHLFLGSSESPDAVAPAFEAIDKKHRIYRSTAGGPARSSVPFLDVSMPSLQVLRVPRGEVKRGTAFETLHLQALQRFASPSVLIDASHQILHLSSGAGRFLEHAGGVPTHNLVTIVQPELRLELRSALFKAVQSGASVEAPSVPMRLDGRDVFVTITVRPFARPEHQGDLLLVMFDDVDVTMQQPVSGSSDRNSTIVEHLEEELRRQKEHLQDSLEQSESSTEELKASNEELQAINEELRSATEELETGKEEVQSMNEELITVNYELKVKIDETGKINDDLQNLIASTDIATLFVDENLNIMRFTPRTIDIFSLIPSDIGRSLLDIRHRLAYDELADDVAEAFRTLRLVEREVASDDNRKFLARLLPYRTLRDQIDGATISFVDVTSLRQAEARSRESESHLRLAAATTKDFAILTMDDDGIVTTWNDGAERMFGYTKDEIVGQPSALLFTPEDRANGVPEQEIRTAQTTGRAEDDRWHLRKDNTRFFCSGVVTPFESGDLHGLAKIGRDITGVRHELTTRDAMLHEERAVRSQYEASSRLKDEFLAIMSHELKHPLNLIHVNAELLMRMPQVREIASVQRAAQVIRKGVMSQAKIIDDLLDLSRARTGKMTLQVVPVDPATTLETIVSAAKGDASAKRITLSWQVESDLPPVACDPVRLEQIVWNLISNAIKYTPEGGHVEVAVDSDGPDMRLSITDSGRGISAAFLPHVFDMFGQESKRGGRSEGGLGIGLALVRELSAAQGGRVEAKSDGVGRGARFTVWLPFFTQPDGTERPATRPAMRSIAGLRILVVEDSREAIEPFLELLRLEGALPVPALDGREAIALLDREDFDLIVSDIAMPDVGGYELIAQVRTRPRFAHVPAIALTGFGRVKDRQDALDAGFDAHVSKPAAIADLLSALDDIARRLPGRATPERSPATD